MKALIVAAWSAIVIAGAVTAALAIAAASGTNKIAPGATRAEAGAVPPFSTPLFIPPVLTDPNISINMQQTCEQVLPGPCTNMWTYNGTFPGPTIRRPTGQTAKVTFSNNLPLAAGPASVHNHGNHSSPENDGSPHKYLIPNGDSREYTYPHTEDGRNEQGATQFYHDHVMNNTGRNVWNGLAGFYIIDDPADPTTLPSGIYDVPLMIVDRTFDASNQIPYTFNTNGVVGDTFLVNGVFEPYLDVGDRKYRFRLLNNANFTSVVLGFGPDPLQVPMAITQIGTESGLLPAPAARNQGMIITPGERLDLVVDFSGKLGQNVYLFDIVSGTKLLEFRVTFDENDDSSIPAVLRPLPDIGTPTVNRQFTFGSNGVSWTINGQPFDHNRIDAQPVIGSTEAWTFINATGAPHVIHVHDVDQQCINRSNGPCQPWELQKESWFIGQGQAVTVKLKFSDFVGEYLIHCHILEHEDGGMMSNFEVISEDGTPTPTVPPATQTPTPSATASPTTAPPTPTPTSTPTAVPTSTNTPSVNTPTPTGTPSVNDIDADGVPNATDNCVSVPNPDQLNTDAAPLLGAPSSSPPLANPPPNDNTRPHGDGAGDACDSDDDNDGLSDQVEFELGVASPPGPCPLTTQPTNSKLLDSDGDGVRDGAECVLGSDAVDAGSRPPTCGALGQADTDGDRLCDPFEAQIGTNATLADTDGDGFTDGVEYRGYNSNALSTDTDGDGCGDRVEIASIDTNKIANSNDLVIVALQFGLTDRPTQDIDKNGIINSSDLLAIALNFNAFCT